MKKLLTLLLTGCGSFAAAQTNLDFELGNFTGWSGFTASYTQNTGPMQGLTPGINSGPVNTSGYPHMIVDGSFPSFPSCVFSPVGQGNYAAVLNYTIANIVSGIEQSFTVTPSNAMLAVSFAFIINDGGHPAAEQAFFRYEALDQNSGIIAQQVYCVGGSNPVLPCDPGTYHLPWTCDTLNLGAYLGQNVTIRFMAGQCKDAGHMGWCYLDAACGPLATEETIAAQESISVFPNPSEHIFTLKAAASLAYRVRNVLGEEILSGTTKETAVPLDLSAQPAGLYLLEVTDGTFRTTKKLLKK